jgi:hypothetical protein
VVPALLHALQALLPLRAARPSQLGAMLDRGLLKLAKAVTLIQETHPWWAQHAPNFIKPPGCWHLTRRQIAVACQTHMSAVQRPCLSLGGLV